MLLECYVKNYAAWMFHKNENWLKYQGRNLEQTDRKVLFYPISIMIQFFIEDSGNLKHPKNVKSIYNSTVSHLASCRVIPRPATMKGWEKEVFWKIHALGNLKCNKGIFFLLGFSFTTIHESQDCRGKWRAFL